MSSRHLGHYRTATAAAVAIACLWIPAAEAADVDPIDLLKRSAAAVEAAASASVDVTISTRTVRNEDVQQESMTFRYQTAPGERFQFFTVPEDGEELAKYGFYVAGNEDVTLTALLGGRRHMIAPSKDGFAAFVKSPLSSGIGSGLGGVALAFLNPVAMEQMSASVIESEFVGEETVDGEPLLRARYTLNGGITSDIWFRAEGAPLVRRIKPDVMATPSAREAARRLKSYDFQMAFDFDDWNTDAGLTSEEVRVTEPKSSLLVRSFYEPPEPKPYPLLGQEAPSFVLAAPDGDLVEYRKPDGEGGAILEFWSIQCPMCLKAMPKLERLNQKYEDRGLEYYAVNVVNEADQVAEFLEQRGFEGAQFAVDTDGDAGEEYQVLGLPLILLVGPDGRIQSAQQGFYDGSEKEIDEKLAAILDGADLAEKEFEARRQAKAKRAAERKRLRSLLDG